MRYVLIDTSIYVSFLEAGFKVTENIKALENLLKVLKYNKIHLIFPDVIYLEYKRLRNEKEKELEDVYDQYSRLLLSPLQREKQPRQLSEDAKAQLIDKLKEAHRKEKEKMHQASDLTEKIFSHKNTHKIKFTEKIFLEAYKRGLEGKRPFVPKVNKIRGGEGDNEPIHDIQPDCLLVESARDFLQEEKNFELFLCVNDSDYFISERKEELDEDIKRDLKVKKTYTKLTDLLNDIFKLKIPEVKKTQIEESTSGRPIIEGVASETASLSISPSPSPSVGLEEKEGNLR